jgi:hypothetical protein
MRWGRWKDAEYCSSNPEEGPNNQQEKKQKPGNAKQNHGSSPISDWA